MVKAAKGAIIVLELTLYFRAMFAAVPHIFVVVVGALVVSVG